MRKAISQWLNGALKISAKSLPYQKFFLLAGGVKIFLGVGLSKIRYKIFAVIIDVIITFAADDCNFCALIVDGI